MVVAGYADGAVKVYDLAGGGRTDGAKLNSLYGLTHDLKSAWFFKQF